MSRRSDRRRDPLSGLGDSFHIPASGVMPGHPCIACGRGDATRVVMVAGEVDWQVAALHVLANIEDLDLAAAIVEEVWADAQEYAPGRRMLWYRLCRGCVTRADAKLGRPCPSYSAAKHEANGYYGVAVHGIQQPPEGAEVTS